MKGKADEKCQDGRKKEKREVPESRGNRGVFRDGRACVGVKFTLNNDEKEPLARREKDGAYSYVHVGEK